MTEQPQDKQLPSLLNTERTHEMVFKEGIGVLENYANKEWCKILIDAFEMYNNQRLQKNILDDHFHIDAIGDGKTQFTNGQLGRKDEQLYLEVADPTLAAHTNAIIGSAFELYSQEYQGITDTSDPVSSWTCKIQKTKAGGGYHVWHCEDGAFVYRDRVLTWMIYLNDIPVENGGATDFLHQECSFQPTTGTMVMWPATYTHMHRGSFLTGDIPKYIATGWFLREPGNVTNRIIGEGLGNVSSHHAINK